MEQVLVTNVYNYIVDNLLSKCKKIALYYYSFNGVTSRKFYVDFGDGFKDCFNMGYDRSIIRNILNNIERIITESKIILNKNEKWNLMTLLMKSNKKFDIEFKFVDLSQTYLEHQKERENQYIYFKK